MALPLGHQPSQDRREAQEFPKGGLDMTSAAHPGAGSMPADSLGPPRGRNLLDQIITALVDGVLVPFINRIVVPIANAIPGLVSSGVAFFAFAALWFGFGLALIVSQGSLDAAWHWIRELPLLVQGVVWVLFLPVVAGLWIWETTWPLVVRLILVAGLAWWNLFMFLPRADSSAKP
jgi:hypothetical protein